MTNGSVFLLTGKVACGKTTYARKKQSEENCLFLSLDEMVLNIFGDNPTREQIDSSDEGCCNYLQTLALKILQTGTNVYLDWGFWKQEERERVRQFFESKGHVVYLYYFDIPLDIRLSRNAKRNNSDDTNSFKIEDKDVALFDSFYETPTEDECDQIIRG
ncbi:P-loop nucleotide/nucleoside kinase family protein [Photobacterium alginatilyticum]|uniref:ATP-binding protein n=1 Tax=Photobacterium alginatilyticum TaxID=1775171 RepID=A0ABW9YQZ3_9GAMM|nr:ATP-binding protein [Photobacterium alginatilyticum]NBI56098.1 ATP-binding protein [Photobacterium alginatilyticum]